MSKRGGRRTGAGRPHKLTAKQRLLVGMACDEISRESIKIATRQKMKGAIDRRAGNIQELYTELNSDEFFSGGRFNHRPALLRAADGASDISEHEVPEKGAEVLMEIQARLANTNRLITVSTARGRPRKEIISEVQQQLRDELGIWVSVHLVERCWNEIRRLIRHHSAPK